jgi:hypothetical protein
MRKCSFWFSAPRLLSLEVEAVSTRLSWYVVLNWCGWFLVFEHLEEGNIASKVVWTLHPTAFWSGRCLNPLLTCQNQNQATVIMASSSFPVIPDRFREEPWRISCFGLPRFWNAPVEPPGGFGSYDPWPAAVKNSGCRLRLPSCFLSFGPTTQWTSCDDTGCWVSATRRYFAHFSSLNAGVSPCGLISRELFTEPKLC